MPEKIQPGQLKLSFPQADSLFRPSLFQPTEQLLHLNRAGMRHVKNAFQVLYATMEDMGYLVNRCPPEEADMALHWSEKSEGANTDRVRIIIEHGWLPRSSYQLSPNGTNARSHVADKFRLGKLSVEQRRYVMHQVALMRQIFSANLDAAKAGKLETFVATPFILFPLQLASDFNLKFSNSPFSHLYSTGPQANLALAQACVDMVEQADLPLPVLFKQHPGDKSALGEMLKFSDQRNRLIQNQDAITVRELFQTGACQLVVGINSNTLHEALVFSIPVIALGSLIWREEADTRPFPRSLEAARPLLGQDALHDDHSLSYLYHLLANQWYLSDFQNPLMVKALLESKAACVPLELRLQCGLGTPSTTF